MMTRAWAWRFAAVMIAGLLIPACKDAGVPAVLFLDTFNGAYPGTNWSPSATGSATAVKDVTNGVGSIPPFESLVMTSSAAASSVTAETTSSFNPAAVTFSVMMAADTASGSDGIGTITIRDFISDPVASVSWNETTNVLTLTIFGATNQTIATPAANLSFHKFDFSVTANGKATWRMDNGAPLITAQNFPPGPWTVELGGSFPTGTTWASFYFDNVTVTTP